MTTDTGQLQKINYNNKMTKKKIFHRLIKLYFTKEIGLEQHENE